MHWRVFMKQCLMHTNYLNKRKKKYLKNGEFVTPLHCACKEHEKNILRLGTAWYCMVLHETEKVAKRRRRKGDHLQIVFRCLQKAFYF